MFSICFLRRQNRTNHTRNVNEMLRRLNIKHCICRDRNFGVFLSFFYSSLIHIPPVVPSTSALHTSVKYENKSATTAVDEKKKPHKRQKAKDNGDEVKEYKMPRLYAWGLATTGALGWCILFVYFVLILKYAIHLMYTGVAELIMSEQHDQPLQYVHKPHRIPFGDIMDTSKVVAGYGFSLCVFRFVYLFEICSDFFHAIDKNCTAVG
jgi:hypothetical protein